MSGRFYKYVFIAAGLLNFAIATVLIFFTDLFVILFQLGAQPIQPVFVPFSRNFGLFAGRGLSLDFEKRLRAMCADLPGRCSGDG